MNRAIVEAKCQHLAVLQLVLSVIATSNAVAQNWRTPNPDQPNGYHASEAASHYHGDLHAPAQPLNGYHASEGRSHYSGSRMEPSDGWHDQATGGPGSAFSSRSTSDSGTEYSGGAGSAFNRASAFQSGGSQNSYLERMRRANQWSGEYHNLRSAGYSPRYGINATNAGNAQQTAEPSSQNYGASSFASRFSTYQPAIQREQAFRQRAIENIESGGGFNRIYSEP